MNGGSYTASFAIAGMRLAASRARAAPDDVPCTYTGVARLRDQRLEVVDLAVRRVGSGIAAFAAAAAVVGVHGEVAASAAAASPGMGPN